MPKVVFIRSNPVAPDPRVEKEAKTLGKNGFSVKVLAWDRSGGYDHIENKGYYKIERVKIRASFGKPTLIFKLFIWSLYELFYLFKEDYDIIHACDLDTLIPAVLISKIRGKKLVYDSFDFYADSLPKETPIFIRKFVANIEIWFSKFPDFVVLADDSRKEQFHNNLKKSIVITNSPVEVKCTGLTKNEQFTIFYAGILQKSRGLNTIITATQDLSDVKLVIGGYDVDTGMISENLKVNDDITFLGKLNYDDVIKRTLNCNMLFALYDPAIPNHRYASPNKLFEAMMCGKPIVVSDNTRMADIVREENCGIVVPFNDISHLEKVIQKIKDNPEFQKKLGENGKKAYKMRYNWNIMEKRLLKAYNNLNL